MNHYHIYKIGKRTVKRLLPRGRWLTERDCAQGLRGTDLVCWENHRAETVDAVRNSPTIYLPGGFEPKCFYRRTKLSYRRLGENEILKPGDEFYDPCYRDWVKTGRAEERAGTSFKYRRRLHKAS